MGPHMKTGLHIGNCLLAGVVVAALTTGSAMAADLRAPVYKAPPPPPPPPVYNWTGFYIGAHVGGAWTRQRFDQFVPFVDGVDGFFPFNDGRRNMSGVIGGGQIGVNWQPVGTPWVLGIEAQFSGADLRTDNFISVFEVNDMRLRNRIDWFGSVAGRLGYAWNNVLLYGKGGVAFEHRKFGMVFLPEPFIFDHDIDRTRTGWMVGAGLEIGLPGTWLGGNWSIKGEYNFMQFSRHNDVFFIDDVPVTFRVRDEINVVKFGLNYRFGAPAPVVARY